MNTNIWGDIHTCISVPLNRHAPLKKKILRASGSSYMSKALRKAIMRRCFLEKRYLKKKTDQSLRAYKKSFNGLNPSFVTDNKL